jgi:hypothetical protein
MKVLSQSSMRLGKSGAAEFMGVISRIDNMVSKIGAELIYLMYE